MSTSAERTRQQPQSQRLAEELGDVADVQPAHQIEAVHFNRAHADAQCGGDFPVGLAHGDHLQNLGLPGSQAEYWFLKAFNPLNLKRGIPSASCHDRPPSS